MAGGLTIGAWPPHEMSRREAIRLGAMLVGGSAAGGILSACSSGSGPLTVAFFGDVQDEGSNVRTHSTRTALDNLAPDFWIFTGDMFADGGNQGAIDQFDAVFGDLKSSGTGTIRPAVGNHDVQYPSSYFENYWDGFLGPSNRHWYSFDLPNGWHVVVLAANGVDFPSAGSAQYTWLADDLAANSVKPTFAVGHKPRWNQSGTHGQASEMSDAWALFDANPQVQFAMSGHVHIYQRFPPLTSAGVESENGIVEIIVPTTDWTARDRTIIHPGNLKAYGSTDDNYGGVAVRLYSHRWESRVIAGAGNPSWGPGIGDDLTTWVSHPFRTGPAPPPVNLLVNPSFETDASTWAPGSSTSITRVTDDYAREGSASLQVTVNAAASPRSLCHVTESGRPAAAPGQTFAVTAWFRCGRTARSLRISLIPYDSSGHFIGDVYGAWQTGLANRWAQVTQTLTMPARTVSVGLNIQVDTGVAGERFWIDAAVLFET